MPDIVMTGAELYSLVLVTCVVTGAIIGLVEGIKKGLHRD